MKENTKNDTVNAKVVPYSSNWGTSRYANDIFGTFDRLFDEFWVNPSFVFERNWKPTWIDEDNDNYLVEVELPGVKRSEINVTTKNNTLKVSAKNNRTSYVRTYSLNGGDFDKVDVKLEDGILYVKIPKLPEAKEKQVEIKETKSLT